MLCRRVQSALCSLKLYRHGTTSALRIILIILLLALGLWQAGADWQATIGEGYAYRFTNIGEALSETWPDRFDADDGAERSVTDWLLAIPIAGTLLVAAGLVWVSRPRRR